MRAKSLLLAAVTCLGLAAVVSIAQTGSIASTRAQGGGYVKLSLVAPQATLGQPAGTRRSAGGTATGWATILSDGFEGAFPGVWTVSDELPGHGEYLWGQRDCQAYEGLYSAWAVGGGTDGAGLSCVADYPDDVLSWMVYGPFSLSDAIAAELTFQLWLDAERDYDLFYYMASRDGEEFYGPPGLSGSADEWTAVTLDLTAVPELGNLAGQPEVWIAFVFASDFAVHYSDGAHVDDVLVRKWVGAAETPTVTASPSATPTTIHFDLYLPLVKQRTAVPTSAATPTASATGCPQSGTWTGKTDQGYPVSLLVSDGPLCRVESLTLTLICPTFLWRATTGTAAITNNHFEASAYDRFLDVHLSVVGDFHSPTEVSGSWYSSSTCLGTWEASYIP